MRFLPIRFPFGLSLLLAATPAFAQPAASTRDSGDAAHLFGYFPKAGMAERFDEGYRSHLDWHRDKRDPLVWYGWYVADGDRLGMFVDGSFGFPSPSGRRCPKGG